MKEIDIKLKVVRVPEDTHKKLKLYAATHDKTKEQVATMAIEKYCK